GKGVREPVVACGLVASHPLGGERQHVRGLACEVGEAPAVVQGLELEVLITELNGATRNSSRISRVAFLRCAAVILELGRASIPTPSPILDLNPLERARTELKLAPGFLVRRAPKPRRVIDCVGA